MYKYTTFQENKLAYQVLGKGEKVLVLLHGFPEDSHIFRNQTPDLEKHFSLIVPDLPGAGQSPYNEKLKNMEDFAGAVNAVLEEENVAKCIMLGHSMGGYITLAFAEKYPQKLQAFGLIHSHASADTKEGIAGREKNIKSMQQYGTHPFLQTMLPGLFAEKFREERQDVINSLLHKAVQMQVRALIRFQEIMIGRKDRTDVLKHASVPVLFVLGAEDQSAKLENVLPQTHMPAFSEVKILQDVGHMGMFEAVQEINKTVLNFVSNV